ncbi:MAG: amidohydrolase family protein [Thermodesulfobacteriota bacterium]
MRKEREMKPLDQMTLNRRQFIGGSALVSAGLLLGSSTLPFLHGCGYSSDWKGIAFPELALTNFKLFDGVHNKLDEGRIVLVEGGVIKDIGRVGDLSTSSNFKVVDLKGCTLMPGLIDNHVHITVPQMGKVNFNFFRQMEQQIVNNFRSCVMGGVTTVRDVGGFPGKIQKYRALADSNHIPGPRVISSLSPIAARKDDRLGPPERAPYFTNPATKWLLGGNYAERPQTMEEVREACERMVALGAQLLKTLYQEQSYSYHPRLLPNHSDEGYKAILEIGRKHGLKCALHEPFVTGFKKGVDLGFNTLEHMPMDDLIPEIYIERFIKQDMAIMPTMMAYGDMFEEEKILTFVASQGTECLVPEAVKQISDKLKESQAQQGLSAEQRKSLIFDRQFIKDKYPNIVKNLQLLYRNGATVGVGTDLGGVYAGIFGRYTDELKRYTAAGISNFDAIRMATAVNAKILGMEDKIGSLKKGAYADLIAVRGNPLDDIQALDTVALVLKGGLFMKAEKSLLAKT